MGLPLGTLKAERFAALRNLCGESNWTEGCIIGIHGNSRSPWHRRSVAGREARRQRQAQAQAQALLEGSLGVAGPALARRAVFLRGFGRIWSSTRRAGAARGFLAGSRRNATTLVRPGTGRDRGNPHLRRARWRDGAPRSRRLKCSQVPAHGRTGLAKHNRRANPRDPDDSVAKHSAFAERPTFAAFDLCAKGLSEGPLREPRVVGSATGPPDPLSSYTQ